MEAKITWAGVLLALFLTHSAAAGPAVHVDGPEEATPGETLTYSVRLTNDGPYEAGDATLSILASPGLTARRQSCRPSGGASCPESRVIGQLVATVRLPVGSALEYEIVAVASPGATGSVTLTVLLETGSPETGAASDQVFEIFETRLGPVDSADLGFEFLGTSGRGQGEAVLGKTFTYTATVTNRSSGDVEGLGLEVVLPMEATLRWSCVTDTCPSSDTRDFDSITLRAGEQRVYAFQSTPLPDQSEDLEAQVLDARAMLRREGRVVETRNSSNQVSSVISIGRAQFVVDGGRPAVAFNGDMGLAVVQDPAEEGVGVRSHIVGKVIDRQGRMQGTPFDISRLESALHPAVAPLPEPGYFIVVWDQEGGKENSRQIVGHILVCSDDLNSTMDARDECQVEEEIVFSDPDATTNQEFPDVVSYSGPSGAATVVWRGEAPRSCDFPSCDVKQTGILVRSVHIEPEGAVKEEIVRLDDDLDRDPQNPSIAAAGNCFAVTWDQQVETRGKGGPGGNPREIVSDIGGHPVSSGGNTPIRNGFVSHADVVFDSQERFFIVWENHETGIEGQFVDMTGTCDGPITTFDGETVPVSSEPADERPRVASASGQIVTVWKRPAPDPVDPDRVFGRHLTGPDDLRDVFETDGRFTSSFPTVIFPSIGKDPFLVVFQGLLDSPGTAGAPMGPAMPATYDQRFKLSPDLVVEVTPLGAAGLAAGSRAKGALPAGTGSVSFRVDVTNTGVLEATDVRIRHELSDGLQLSGSSGCTIGQDLVCSLGSLEAGAGRDYVLIADIGPDPALPLEIQLDAMSADEDGFDPDNTVVVTTRLGVADLSIELEESRQQDRRLTIPVVVTQRGPDPAPDVRVTIDLPSGVTGLRWRDCPPDARSPRECRPGELAAGEVHRLHLEVVLPRGMSGSFPFGARVDTVAADPEPDNNVFPRRGGPPYVVEVAPAGLTIDLEAAPDPAVAGEALTYTLTVTYNGDGTAADTVVVGELPTDWRPSDTGPCSVMEGRLRCVLGDLGDRDQRVVRLAGVLSEDARGSLEARALARSAGTLPHSTGVTTRVVPPGVLLLREGRFEVRLDWRNQHDGGTTGRGHPMRHSESSGLFWFFDRDNVELLVNLLDGRNVNGHFWLYYGALTDLEYTLRVKDTATGVERTYHSPAGDLCGGGDIRAFPATGRAVPLPIVTPPTVTPAAGDAEKAGTGGACTPGPECLGLYDDRIRVEVAWRDPDGGRTGRGRVIQERDRTGYFWFFNPEVPDLGIKVLDGRPFDGNLWVFWGGLSDVGATLTVTDTLSGVSRTYEHPAGEICGGLDRDGFPRRGTMEAFPAID